MSTRGLRFSRIIVSVPSSWTRPRSERYSHCTGTMTPSEAVSALMVSEPERRRRVDEDVVVAAPHGQQRLLKSALTADHAGQRELGAGKVDRRDGDVDLGAMDDFFDRQRVDEDVDTSSARPSSGSMP